MIYYIIIFLHDELQFKLNKVFKLSSVVRNRMSGENAHSAVPTIDKITPTMTGIKYFFTELSKPTKWVSVLFNYVSTELN